MEQIICKECRKTLKPEEVIREGRGDTLTCSFCGMSASLTVIYTPEQRAEAKAQIKAMDEEYLKNA